MIIIRMAFPRDGSRTFHWFRIEVTIGPWAEPRSFCIAFCLNNPWISLMGSIIQVHWRVPRSDHALQQILADFLALDGAGAPFAHKHDPVYLKHR